jgi:preprotein translocase SecE subunit
MTPILSSTIEYFRGAVTELRQVRWPTRNQAVRLSLITIAFTFATAIAYGIVDFFLGRAMSALLFFA